MATPAIVGSALGFPANFGQHIQNMWSNSNGDSVVVSPTAGNCLVTIVIGMNDFDPFDVLHAGNTNPAFLADYLSFNPAPTVTDTASQTAHITNVSLTTNVVTITAANGFAAGQQVTISGLVSATFLNGQTLTIATASGTQFTAAFTHADYASHADSGTATEVANVWTAAGGQLVGGDFDYTASLGDFTRSSKWSLDGYYPNVYMFYALDVAGGTYSVNTKSVYQDHTTPTRPVDLAAGKPVFDGGVDIHVLEFSGIVASAASDGAQGGMSAANPAVSPSFTTTTAGDLILTAGVMKSANAFSTFAPAGTTGTVMLAQGKCVGSEAHWGIQMQLQTSAGLIAPGFSNPLGYEMAVKSLALKHS